MLLETHNGQADTTDKTPDHHSSWGEQIDIELLHLGPERASVRLAPYKYIALCVVYESKCYYQDAAPTTWLAVGPAGWLAGWLAGCLFCSCTSFGFSLGANNLMGNLAHSLAGELAPACASRLRAGRASST